MTVTVQRSIQHPSSSNTSSSSPSSQTPSAGGVSPSPYPRQICGEPRRLPVHDDLLGMCYDVSIYCGVTPELAIERFRRMQQAQNLSRDVGVRIHQNVTPPTNRSPNNSTNNSNSSSSILDTVGQVIIGILSLPFALQGCSSGEPHTVPEIPDGSAPPPNTDSVCGSRRSYILDNDPLRSIRGAESSDGGMPSSASARVLAELQRQYPGIELPTLNVSFEGNSIWNDSAGNPIREIRTSDPVSFHRIDNRLYVLTANRSGEAFNPATWLVYDTSVSPPRPVPTSDITTFSSGGASNAIVLGYYNPVAMAPMVGGNEIDVLFGAPNAGIVTTLDPFALEIIASDWCSTHDVDGGARTDSAVDAQPDASVDASRDTSDAGSASDADAGAPADASDAGAMSDASPRDGAADVNGDGRPDAMADVGRTDARIDAGSDARVDARSDVPRRG